METNLKRQVGSDCDILVLFSIFSLCKSQYLKGTHDLQFSHAYLYKFKSNGFIELFFCKKKYLLVGVTGQWMSHWVSESVRDVYMSHQSDWIYYKQPIKFLVVKVNGIRKDLI